ncbi:hypothetical protein Mgra_00009859 [Meloidogyne graminicola]|uniref:Uncharacterized protein n=1 Tax=Meloidogyne graminicola TaxID=189291 RepID=A0A8S9ZAM4_9BILA|nr:hypothetical protein Mgra_00009859 [Meloidogyne graminicola]
MFRRLIILTFHTVNTWASRALRDSWTILDELELMEYLVKWGSLDLLDKKDRMDNLGKKVWMEHQAWNLIVYQKHNPDTEKLKSKRKATKEVLDNCSVFGRVVKLMFETQLFVADTSNDKANPLSTVWLINEQISDCFKRGASGNWGKLGGNAIEKLNSDKRFPFRKNYFRKRVSVKVIELFPEHFVYEHFLPMLHLMHPFDVKVETIHKLLHFQPKMLYC